MPLGGARIESPLKTVDFLDGYADILGRRFEGSSPEDLLDSSGKYTPFPVSRCAVPGGKQPVALPPHSFNGDSSADTSLCQVLTPAMERRELAPPSLESRLPPAPLSWLHSEWSRREVTERAGVVTAPPLATAS